MFVIMMGNTDLSVGSQIAICGVVGALVVSKFPENSAMGAAAAILATLATAVACGAFNGFLIAYAASVLYDNIGDHGALSGNFSGPLRRRARWIEQQHL